MRLFKLHHTEQKKKKNKGLGENFVHPLLYLIWQGLSIGQITKGWDMRYYNLDEAMVNYNDTPLG